jgi:hypothetical protein
LPKGGLKWSAEGKWVVECRGVAVTGSGWSEAIGRAWGWSGMFGSFVAVGLGPVVGQVAYVGKNGVQCEMQLSIFDVQGAMLHVLLEFPEVTSYLCDSSVHVHDLLVNIGEQHLVVVDHFAEVNYGSRDMSCNSGNMACSFCELSEGGSEVLEDFAEVS